MFRRLADMFATGRISADPVAVLWHYLSGHMANAVGPQRRPAWTETSHRGVQWLDKVEFPRKQKRYIFAPQFEIRYNTAFEEVVRACSKRPGDELVWISENLIHGLVGLHRMGFANSYEAWQDGKLVGGAFGVQLGSMISCDSMFHRVSNSSKAAYGQTLVYLQKRGFKIVDTNGVASHQVNYGEEWMPHWTFQRQIFECLKETPSFADDRPCPKLPWEIRAMIPALRVGRMAARRLPWVKPPAPEKEENGATDGTGTPATSGGSPEAAASPSSPPPQDDAERRAPAA